MVRATIFDTRVKALMGSGTEICPMSRTVAEIAGLSIWAGQNLSMVAATWHKARFVGVCMNRWHRYDTTCVGSGALES